VVSSRGAEGDGKLELKLTSGPLVNRLATCKIRAGELLGILNLQHQRRLKKLKIRISRANSAELVFPIGFRSPTELVSLRPRLLL